MSQHIKSLDLLHSERDDGLLPASKHEPLEPSAQHRDLPTEQHACLIPAEQQKDLLIAEQKKDNLPDNVILPTAQHEETEPALQHEGLHGGQQSVDQFHAKANRTLLVGNISKEVCFGQNCEELKTIFLTQVLSSEIHDRFKEFGEIIEIDIKKLDYALVQFADIVSVVKAIRIVDGELIAGQRVRLSFGLSVATKCVWCDGVGPDVTEQMLHLKFGQYGKIQDLIIDRSRGHALVYFDQVSHFVLTSKNN